MDNKEFVDKVSSGEFPTDIRVPLDSPFIDGRGMIQNLWLGGSGSVTFIKSTKGSVRAKHKHTNDWHATYVLSGEIKYIEGEPDGVQSVTFFKAGDLFFTRPDVYHTMIFETDCDMITINGIIKNHENYEKDIQRY